MVGELKDRRFSRRTAPDERLLVPMLLRDVRTTRRPVVFLALFELLRQEGKDAPPDILQSRLVRLTALRFVLLAEDRARSVLGLPVLRFLLRLFRRCCLLLFFSFLYICNRGVHSLFI